ncbi:hypothetical protein ACFYE9_02290 [Rhizobium leguminosarum]|uniref:Uncharacterized protein n=1 Tax=Rhizobium leguminosarum TaxID=384 RepID=A0ACD5FFH2_RHILE|nr:hypothetical protein [Rhizobium leguminosarum]
MHIGYLPPIFARRADSWIDGADPDLPDGLGGGKEPPMPFADPLSDLHVNLTTPVDMRVIEAHLNVGDDGLGTEVGFVVPLTQQMLPDRLQKLGWRQRSSSAALSRSNRVPTPSLG